ncbi:vitellogenin-1-like [Bradysia coprophila]|uniref:vitellogenin-1-like n=1 Tax=Bradysia coprophila TaxID=38358 RepID=UPI00187DD81C|nr:vitellogenin-1-like [Bradysia coprophila]
MKGTLLLVLVLVGLVSGFGGSWRRHKYKYKLSARTFITSPDSKWSGVAYRTHLSIHPQSNDLLIGQLSQTEYAEIDDREYDEIADTASIENDLKYDDRSDMNKPFRIQLENGVIRRLFVDASMAEYESDVLKVMLSAFQVNTNVQNRIQEEDNHAMYKVMESTATGNCETLYDVSTLTDDSNVPLPVMRDEGELILITKRRDNSNFCDKNTGYQAPTTEKTHQAYVDEEVGTVILSGSLNSFTIESSTTSQTISVDQKKSFYKNVNVTLEYVESVEENADNLPIQHAPDGLKDVGSLLLSDNLSFDEDLSDMVAMSDVSVTQLQADNDIEFKWTNCYWSSTASAACQNDLGPEFEWHYGSKKSCGIFRTAYLCKKTYPGCVQTACFSGFVPPITWCEKQFGDSYPIVSGECAFDNGCFYGFYRNRCCPRK